MKTSELLKLTRQAIRDTVKPYLWTDEELVGFLTEGEQMGARNARLLRDFSTPETCRLSIVTTKQAYNLDRRVIFVRRLVVASRSTPLRKISYRDLDIEQPGWIDRTGTPDRWCGDFESGRIWLNKKPTAADTAKLLVVRLPLKDLSTSEDRELEIPVAYHRAVHHWAAYRAHSKPDTETEDPKRAQYHYDAFTNQFGEESKAIDEEWERQHYGDEDMEGEL